MHTPNIHALRGIRPQGPSVQADEHSALDCAATETGSASFTYLNTEVK
jgi:hypothetical protein